MFKLYQGIDFHYSGGECDTVIKVDKYAITIIDGYLVVYDTENDINEDEFYIFDNSDVNRLLEKYQFIGGIEVFYRSHSGLSGNIKLLIDLDNNYEYAFFRRLYNDCVKNVIFGHHNMLILCDRDNRSFIWLPRLVETNEPIARGHVVYTPTNTDKPILGECRVYKTPCGKTIRVVGDESMIAYDVIAVEIKSWMFRDSLWKDRWGRYFYANKENVVDVISYILKEGL